MRLRELRGQSSRRSGQWGLYLMCAPILLFLILPIFVVYPLAFSSSSIWIWPPPGFSLYWVLDFFSDPKSRHCANVGRNPAASAAIHENYADWREIRGLQIEGRVEDVSVVEIPAMMSAYVAKFPFVRDLLTPEGLFRVGGKMIDARFYKLMPSRCVLLDNSKGFGHREELILS